MNFMQTKYLTPNGETLEVVELWEGYRAHTDDEAFLNKYVLGRLPNRMTEKDAQTDLDQLADKLNLRIEGNQ